MGRSFFDVFRRKYSPVRRRVQDLLVVNRTWFEWTFESGQRRATLVVEVDFETDPAASGFYGDGLEQIGAAIEKTEDGEDLAALRVRVIPRKY